MAPLSELTMRLSSKNFTLPLDSWLSKFQIKIEMGETFNKNRNPIAENLVKECHKEVNKAGYNALMLALVLRNINSRIRDRGLSSKEMCFMRDQATNRNINHKDCVLKDQQKENREKSHNNVIPDNSDFDMGETVMVKNQLSKTKPREKYVVVNPELNDTHVTIQKQDKKFLAKQYEVPKHQLLRIPRKAAVKARQRISKSAHLCQVKTFDPQVPIHAFDDPMTSDDEDLVYYTPKTYIFEDTLDSTSSQNSTNDNLDHDSSCNIEEDDSEDSSVQEIDSPSPPPQLTRNRLGAFRRTQRLDDLIQQNNEFLSNHPTPPRAPRKSTRNSTIPDRYPGN